MAEPGPSRGAVCGLVLAGGRGARMGGADKGWVPFEGRPLVEHVLQRLAPQVDGVMISANRNIERYRGLAAEVLEDDAARFGAFPGPLGGMLAGLEQARHPWVAVVPCDAPALPLDLVARLAAASPGAPAVVARCGGRLQPVFCLLQSALAPRLAAALQAGEHRPGEFLHAIAARVVEFAEVDAFRNVNALAQEEGGRG